MADQISISALAEWMQRELPGTFDLFTRAVGDGDELTKRWASGRVDSFLQVLGVIDKNRYEMLRAEWVRIAADDSWVDPKT
ncbi:MAG TPA: hypothetical protein PLQ19_06595 [Aeromicrobium sp.]|nr:hypothetical protein [Aeromicrobium sp.]